MYTIKQAAEMLSRPYSTIYKLVKELNICPGDKHKRISQADMENLRRELGERQERKTGQRDEMGERLDDLEAKMAELRLIQESQIMALESVDKFLAKMADKYGRL